MISEKPRICSTNKVEFKFSEKVPAGLYGYALV